MSVKSGLLSLTLYCMCSHSELRGAEQNHPNSINVSVNISARKHIYCSHTHIHKALTQKPDKGIKPDQR